MFWWFVAFGVIVCISSFFIFSAIAEGLRLQKAQHAVPPHQSRRERDLSLCLVQLEYILQALPLITAPAFAYMNNRKKLKDYDLSRIALIYSAAYRDMQKRDWQDAHGSALYAVRLCQRVITDVCLEVALEKTRRSAGYYRTPDGKFDNLKYALTLNHCYRRFAYEPWAASEVRNGENRMPDYLAKFDQLFTDLAYMLESGKKGD